MLEKSYIYNKRTDEDLKKLFEGVLTEEDWKYIEKVAVESDPAGGKR